MITLFTMPTSERTDAVSSLRASLPLHLFLGLAPCLVATLGCGALLARVASPQMVRLCAAGRSLGLAELGLLYLWFRTLIDMWGYPAQDLLRFR